MQLVIDTNVWISAALSRQSVPAQVIRLALQKQTIIFSTETWDELQSRLAKPKFDTYLSFENRRALLHDWWAVAQIREVDPEAVHRSYCRDAQDDKFFRLTLSTNAVLISGDADILDAPPIDGLQVYSPAQAIAVLRG